jgi:Integrase zinc binding domain/Chromo (CHRromatin Organisation MOdifier) domain
MEKKIILRYHDNVREGHQGVARTMEKIQRSYYFPGMFRKIKKIIKECDSCNRNKNEYEKPKGLMQEEKDKPSQPWEKLTADFLEMPSTRHPFLQGWWDELLVVVDTFSKQTVLIPTRKTADTEEIFHWLWERIFSIFGIPRTMLSDRDRIFKTKKWADLMKDIGATQILSTAHHQQTDGQTERKIQELQAFYRHYMDFTQENWISISPLAQYMANDARSATTGETPNFVTFGTERIKGFDQRDDKTIGHDERMRIIHKEVELDLEWASAQRKKYYDRKRVEPFTLKKGERVYLRRRTSGKKKSNIKTIRRSSKFDCVKLGPFMIEEVLDYDNYKLKLPNRMRVHPIFHISLLSKTSNPEDQQNTQAIDDEEYEVQKIVGKRTRKGRTEYLVQWLGYGDEDNTWEETANLSCPERIQEFETENRSSSNPASN